MNALLDAITGKIAAATLHKSPIDHIVIENFLPEEMAAKLSGEFEDWNSPTWHSYQNALELKKTCNQWNLFKNETYFYFSLINSDAVAKALSEKFDIEMVSDPGLHGGGQHAHAQSGNLNPHLDYSIHPKLGLERRVNVIYYLSDEYNETDGGHFGLWGNESPSEPGTLIKEIAPLYNCAVIFNTSQNSWHGMSRKYDPAPGKMRKSLASYYVSEPREDASERTRALFAPRENQAHDEEVLDLIKKRADEKLHKSTYRTEG